MTWPDASRSPTSWSWPKKRRVTTSACAALAGPLTPIATDSGRTSTSQAPLTSPGRQAAELAARAPVVRVAGQHLDVAEELRHPARGRAQVDLLRRAGLLDAAVAHHRDRLGDAHRLLLVVRDEQRRHARRAQDLRDLLAQAVAQRGVEVGERLVEQHEVGRRRERARERDALLLAAGELVHRALLRAGRGRRARAPRGCARRRACGPRP